MVRLSQFNLSPSNFFQFNFFKVRQSNQIIELKRFINFDLDTFGWYALGHHSDKTFLAIVNQKEPVRTPSYEIRRVWTEWEGDRLQEASFFAPNAKPITIIEFYV
jgi:hypothetical protein